MSAFAAAPPPEQAPLAELISIGAGFRRSINLERDSDAIDLIRAYRPTSRALAALEQLADGLNGQSAARALALIGPYGGGKSAFALFASALLAGPDHPARPLAEANLRAIAPDLAQRLSAPLGDSRGLLRIQVNGIPDSLTRQLLRACARAAARERLPAPLIKRIESAAQPDTRMDRVLALLGELKLTWTQAGGHGLLIELDELGKFLEYEAHGNHQREMHLLQLLAENAAAPGTPPTCVLVMLHQTFEQYQGRLGKSLRDEWAKVQGRFSAIAFLEPAEQSLRLLAAAIERQGRLPAALDEQMFAIACELAECAALPAGLDLSAAVELFQASYPLHPVSQLILPVLCQRIAQNERTLFSYLGSTEARGFLSRLHHLHVGDWIAPWELYDYFVLNQAGGFSDPLTYHRWIEVITALERYEGEPEVDDTGIWLLKTIGLLNLIGAQRGLKASERVLRLLFGDALDPPLAALQTASIIHFRVYSGEYRVWQGSDFDLRAALDRAAAEQSGRSLADLLNSLVPLSPMVARRASIETGTLRGFRVRFISADRWPPEASNDELTLWLYLAEPAEIARLDGAPELAVVAVCRSTERLRERVSEWQALLELPRLHAELQQDPVAMREHLAWLENAEVEAMSAIRALIDSPGDLEWFFSGESCRIEDRRQLQMELSHWVRHRCFPLSPIIRNELINRDHPSAAAATGRKKLLAAMLDAPDRDGLGIEKNPAEKSLYLSLLRESRLHRPGADGRWDFFPPERGRDPCVLSPCWEDIHRTLGDAGQRQVPVTELYARLQAPPFGIRLGVLPILLIAYLIAHRRETALYQEGAFSERLSIEQAELLCRRPALFALERFALSGLRGELFERYLGSIVGKLTADATLLDIVRPLLQFARQLPEYSQHCAGLSDSAERVRGVFRQAKSPGILLFEELPRACGFAPESLFPDVPNGKTPGAGESSAAATVEPFIARLIAVLREMNGVYPALLEHWRRRLAQTLLQQAEPGDLANTRAELARRYRGLDRYAAQQGKTGAFLRRLCDTQHHENPTAWLESLMTLLAKVPPAKWRESHRINAELQLEDMAGQVADLEALCQSLPEGEGLLADGQDSFILKLVRPGREERRQVVRLDARQRQAAEMAADELEDQLKSLDPATQAAVLAKLLDRLSNDG